MPTVNLSHRRQKPRQQELKQKTDIFFKQRMNNIQITEETITAKHAGLTFTLCLHLHVFSVIIGLNESALIIFSQAQEGTSCSYIGKATEQQSNKQREKRNNMTISKERAVLSHSKAVIMLFFIFFFSGAHREAECLKAE